MSKLNTTIWWIKRLLPTTAIAVLLVALLSGAVFPQGRNVKIAQENAGLSLEWRGISNATYRVEQRTNLLAGAWEASPPQVASNVLVSWPIETANSPTQFFRILFPTPEIDSCAPAFAPSTGGTTVLVTGSYFYEGDQIRVSGVLLSNVVFVSHHQLSGVLPELTPGLYAVEVVNGQQGGVLATLPDALTVLSGWVEGWGVPSWRDEFDGTTIDTAKWEVLDETYLSYDWAYIKKESAAIDTTTQTLKLSVTLLATPIVTKQDGRLRIWQTAYLKSTMTAEYGRWEMRAKIPTIKNISSGVWPGFWHRAVGGQGEIDTLEAWGSPVTRPNPPSWWSETSTFTVHENTQAGVGVKEKWTYERTLDPQATSYHTASTGFHVWTLEKTPNYIKSYLDNQLVATLTPATYPWAFGPTFTGYPLDTRLNIQMGDPYWTPDPQPGPDTVLPAVYEIDYVRYWAVP